MFYKLGVTNVGHCDLIDLCDKNFKVIRNNLGLITQKKWVANLLLPIILFDFLNH